MCVLATPPLQPTPLGSVPLVSRYGKRKKSKDEAYATFQKGRVFFEVDEEIPTDIRSYKGCILIKSGDERFLVKGRSQYNPVWLNFKRWGDDV